MVNVVTLQESVSASSPGPISGRYLRSLLIQNMTNDQLLTEMSSFRKKLFCTEEFNTESTEVLNIHRQTRNTAPCSYEILRNFALLLFLNLGSLLSSHLHKNFTLKDVKTPEHPQDDTPIRTLNKLILHLKIS